MHAQKIRSRGFNQAAILARSLAKILKIPCDLTCCQKIINTLPQASLEKKERQSNLKNAFRATPVPYKHIALIDDLLTTGSTANEVAFTFKKIGVEQVDVWCCARTIEG